MYYICIKYIFILFYSIHTFEKYRPINITYVQRKLASCTLFDCNNKKLNIRYTTHPQQQHQSIWIRYAPKKVTL